MSESRARAAALVALLLAAVLPARGGDGPAVADLPPLLPAGAGEILDAVRGSGARAVLLNVWATWCLPCREEVPDLLRVRRELRERGLEVILVSADFEADRQEAARFLAMQGVDFPSFFKMGRDEDFIDGLDPRWTGALPASFVFDGTGRLRLFREGQLTYEAFRRMALDVLDEPGATTMKEGP
jgi:thiol-disulfide isomerase/thioredoxin